MADKKYKLSLQLTFDGNQAKQEAQRTGKALESIADSQKGALRLLVDGSQARKELEAIADLARKTAEIIEKPRTFVVRSAVDLGVKQGTAPLSSGISGGKMKVLPGMDKQQLEKLDKQMAKSVLMTIDADGTPAIAEADKTQKEIDDKGKELKPWTVKMYDKAFKGFGADLSKMTGLDKVNAGIQSGLGKALGWLNIGFAAVGKVAGFAFRGISAGVRLVGSMIKTGLTLPVKLATGAFKALGVAAAAAGAGVYAGVKAINPASEMEQFAIQLEVMLKSASKAQERLKELAKYAKETNYGAKEIVEAGALMEAFGFYSKRNLELAGDAANAFGKDIRDIIYSLNYLATGRAGEAFRSLASLGITREKLEPYGIKFSGSQLVTDYKVAFDAVLKYFEDEFGGMTARQSRTWRGAMQQAGGEVYTAFAVGFEGALTPLTNFLQGRVIPLIDAAGKRLEDIDWEAILSRPLKLFGGLAEMIRQVTDPKTSEAGISNIKEFGKQLWSDLKSALGLLPTIGKAFVSDLAATFESFFSSGGFEKVFEIGLQSLKLSWKFGASLLSQVLTSFSREFQSDLKIFLERFKLFGKQEETSKRYMAILDASKSVAMQMKQDDPRKFAQMYKSVREDMRKNWSKSIKKLYERDVIFEGTEKEWVEAEALRRVAGLGAADNKYYDLYNKETRRLMQWDEERASPFYQSPQELKDAVEDFTKALKDFKFEPTYDETAKVLKALPANLKAALSGSSEMLGGFDEMGRRRQRLEKIESDLLYRKQSLIDDRELARLEKTGWEKSADGELIERESKDYLKNLSYKEAREDHWRRSAAIRQQIRVVDLQLRRVERIKDREAQRAIQNKLTAEVEAPKSEIKVEPKINVEPEIKNLRTELNRKFSDINLFLAQSKIQQQQSHQELQKITRILAEVLEV